MLDAQSLDLKVGAGSDIDDPVPELIGQTGDFLGLCGIQLVGGDANSIHISRWLVALAIEESVPLHPLQIGRVDVLHRRARAGVALHVGPNVEAVLLGLPNLDRICHRLAPSLRILAAQERSRS